MARRSAKQAVSGRVEKFNEALSRCKRRLDRENIHLLRVGIRRLQAGLRLCKPLLEKGLAKSIRRQTRPLMKLAGRVRDCDIADSLAQEAGLGRLHRFRASVALERQRRAAELKVAVRVLPPLETPKFAPGTATADPELLDLFFKAGEAASAKASNRQLHALRISGKQLRYTIEFLAPDDDRLEALRTLQDLLGGLNDCVTTRRHFPNRTLDNVLAVRIRQYKRQFRELWAERFSRDRWMHLPDAE